MVLRSGIIIPFQFRDSKKLLMVGGVEEERDVTVWDLKNVVRAAFGVYNFEFRNKQIGFNIPEDLLLHYLGQSRDLTNFVIEIGLANATDATDLVGQRTCETDMHLLHTPHYGAETTPTPPNRLQSPLMHTHVTELTAGDVELPHKIRLPAQMYSAEHSGETLTQSIDPLDIIPKSEHDEAAEMEAEHELALHQHQHQQREQQQQQLQDNSAHYFTNYHNQTAATMLTSPGSASNQLQPPPSPMPSQQLSQQQLQQPPQLPQAHQSQQSQYSSTTLNRFRIYDPYKDNHPHLSGCSTCHCAAVKPLDLHDANTNTTNSGIGVHHLSSQPERSHSNVSANSLPSPQSQNALDEASLPPPLKLRVTTVHPQSADVDANEIDYEQKSAYDANAMHLETEMLSRSPPTSAPPPPPTTQSIDEAYLQQQHEQQHFERLQHEYFIQHQHQHQQQQQQQQQQHMEPFYQESTTNSLRQRKERMSKKQKEIYVNFLEQNPLINEHRRNDVLLDHYWAKLADILNSVPQGAVKHVAEWKQTFDNWRYRVYLYARFNSKISGDAALNPKSFKPLTHTDKRAYAIWIRNPDTAPPDLEKMRNVFVNLDETLPE